MVGLHQILAGNVITCLELVSCPHAFERGVGTRLAWNHYKIVNAVSSFERNILLRLRSNCN